MLVTSPRSPASLKSIGLPVQRKSRSPSANRSIGNTGHTSMLVGIVEVEIPIQRGLLWFISSHPIRKASTVNVLQFFQVFTGAIDERQPQIIVDHRFLDRRVESLAGAVAGKRLGQPDCPNLEQVPSRLGAFNRIQALNRGLARPG